MIPKRNVTRTMAGWLLLPLVAGCDSGAQPEGAALSDATPAVRSEVTQERRIPGSPADAPPGALVAVDRCGAYERDPKIDCYQEIFLAVLRDEGIGPALDLLEATAAVDESVARFAHVFTHGIGITAYERNPNVTEVFPQCREVFQSGCYHGVIQAHFTAAGAVDEAVVNELCQRYKAEGADRWILFQCLHGLGHGLTMFHRHDVPLALEGCDMLAESWDRPSCYGGVFMENIVNVTNPHHVASDGAAMDGLHGTSDWKAVDPEDPHYPCSVLDGRYHHECYMMQTSAMLWINGGDIAGAGESCRNAPENVRHVCFQSLGRDISSLTLQDPDDAMRECARTDVQYRAWCYVGLVKNFIDLTAHTEKAFEFCRRVVHPPHKMSCYEAIGEEIAILENASDDRDAICVNAESEETYAACLLGAGVRTGAGGARVVVDASVRSAFLAAAASDISVGETVSGFLSPADAAAGLNAQTLRFRGTPGEIVTVSLASEDLNAFLGVIGPDLGMFEDDDSGGGQNGHDAQLTFQVVADGVHVLIVTVCCPGIPSGAAEGGSFTLRVDRGRR